MPFNRVVRFLPAFCLLWAIGVTPARAEPITITSGSLVIAGLGGRPMTLQGTQGFSFDGGLDSLALVVPLTLCVIRCDPGATLPIRSFAVGTDVRGDVTYLGESFGVGSLAASSGNMVVEFTGEAVLPPLAGPTADVTVPFLLGGSIVPPRGSTLPAGTISGGGLATLALRPTAPGIPPGWSFQRLEYLFIEDPSVVPEPASMLLVGSGIGLLLQIRRCARRSRSPIADR